MSGLCVNGSSQIEEEIRAPAAKGESSSPAMEGHQGHAGLGSLSCQTLSWLPPCPHQDRGKSLIQSLQVPQSTELELKILMNKTCSISLLP